MPASIQDASIGRNIQKLRRKANLTQAQLVAKMQVYGCDMSRGTLAKIEAGIRRIYAEELKCLKAVLKVEYRDILE